VPSRTIWFETRPRPFKIPSRVRGYSEQLGPLLVSEHRRRSAGGPYVIRFQGTAHSREEVDALRSAAFTLADEIDHVWAYVAGVPLFPTVTTLSLPKAPTGWVTNADRAKPTLPITRAFIARVRLRQTYLVTLPYLPLNRALTAVRSLRTADEVTRLLVDLHIASLRGRTGTTSMVFLAKALELIRALLPGRSDHERQRHLLPDAQADLRRSLHWLYGIANQRVEVRHVVRDPTRLELHAKLTPEERRDYQFEGDLVARAVISERLRIPLVLRRRPWEP
jgi:hypothetical protein